MGWERTFGKYSSFVIYKNNLVFVSSIQDALTDTTIVQTGQREENAKDQSVTCGPHAAKVAKVVVCYLIKDSLHTGFNLECFVDQY